MSELVFDVIEMAKTYQWEIDMIDDPLDAAMQANKALMTLNQITDERLNEGVNVIVRAFGAYALHQWNEDEQRYVDLHYDPLTIEGESAGIGFVQNAVGSFQLKTIFVGMRNSNVIEAIDLGSSGMKRVNTEKVPRIFVPVLDIDTLEMAA